MDMETFSNEWRSNGVSNPSYNVIRHSHPPKEPMKLYDVNISYNLYAQKIIVTVTVGLLQLFTGFTLSEISLKYLISCGRGNFNFINIYTVVYLGHNEIISFAVLFFNKGFWVFNVLLDVTTTENIIYQNFMKTKNND